MKPNLVVALDFPHPQEALAMAQKLRGTVSWVKVGLELFLAAEKALVSQLKDMGFAVFLDLKFLDIPNTVAGAVRQACCCGADMLTVHALGGEAMIQAAIQARDQSGASTAIVAVTVLTHLGPQHIPWAALPLNHLVLHLAQSAWRWGADGVVCSGLEVQAIRAATAPHFLLVTPGLRLPGDRAFDQSRICTPAEAAQAGAHFLVMGRPITQAPDPAAIARRIQESLEALHE